MSAVRIGSGLDKRQDVVRCVDCSVQVTINTRMSSFSICMRFVGLRSVFHLRRNSRRKARRASCEQQHTPRRSYAILTQNVPALHDINTTPGLLQCRRGVQQQGGRQLGMEGRQADAGKKALPGPRRRQFGHHGALLRGSRVRFLEHPGHGRCRNGEHNIHKILCRACGFCECGRMMMPCVQETPEQPSPEPIRAA